MAEYKLNMTPDLMPPMLSISQGDVGRIITINLLDHERKPYNIPSGATVQLLGIKPSGLGFTVNGTVAGSTVAFGTTEEMSDEAGVMMCEVKITSGATVIGSSNARLFVENNPHPDGTTDGTREQLIDEITVLVNRAETASENAAESALRAEDAAQRAEEATAKITEVVAVAETLPEGSDATAVYDDGILTLGIPRGNTGETGAQGVGISSVVLNADYTLTINLTNGSQYTTTSIRGAQGEQGVQGERGIQGEQGVGISTVALNQDYTLTITLTNGQSYTTTSIRGAQGEQGPAGKDAELTILKYGTSTWADFIAAYRTNTIIYCRASSNSNPATGSQTRLAFMAYVNNETNPTEVEFQYYRSVTTHSDAQQGDQVFVYKLTSGGTWTVTVRESYTKIAAGTGLSSSYSSGTLTLTNTNGLPAVTATDNGKILRVANGAWVAELLPSASGVSF